MSALRILIVAGEASGDILAAGLITAILQLRPDAIIEGVAGPKMLAAGCKVLIPQEKLNVMGFIEPLLKLPQLLNIRRQLLQHTQQNPPDIFIGVDYPEFNFSLEKSLKTQGIRTVHYVSPSLWAWRPGRIKRIKKTTDLMLCVLPFETQYYAAADIAARYVGHTLADEIPFENDQKIARHMFNLPEQATIIALMPGSRASELNYLAELFITTAQDLVSQMPELIFIVPMINEERQAQFTEIWQRVAPNLPIIIIRGQSRDVIIAADVVLVASGTATLETMLLKKPMVVAYRMSSFTYWLAKQLVKIPYIALPNILAGQALVPEFIQTAAQPKTLAAAILNFLNHPEYIAELRKKFFVLHQQLRCNASMTAAKAVLDLTKDVPHK